MFTEIKTCSSNKSTQRKKIWKSQVTKKIDQVLTMTSGDGLMLISNSLKLLSSIKIIFFKRGALRR
jgi:hypothetical protein